MKIRGILIRQIHVVLETQPELHRDEDEEFIFGKHTLGAVPPRSSTVQLHSNGDRIPAAVESEARSMTLDTSFAEVWCHKAFERCGEKQLDQSLECLAP